MNFKKGDLVICIDNYQASALKLGKRYIITNANDVFVAVKACDSKYEGKGWFPGRFTKVSKELI
jgi:hypothetical protein